MTAAQNTNCKEYLIPRLDTFPSELRSKNNWVVWKGEKIPFDASFLNSKASVSDPHSWSSFDRAKTAYEDGGWDGLGFMLDGTGIAGVDLDDCVINHVPKRNAIEILENLNAQYVELSPSGGGLRAFGYADSLPRGRKGVLNGVSTELYTKNRYLTVTGHVIKYGEFKQFENFSNLANLLYKKLPSTEDTEDTEVTEDTESNPSASSVGIEGLVIPSSLIPTSYGQRNKKLFELARWLKGVRPECDRKMQEEIVRRWHDVSLPNIKTKDFASTWLDFKYGLGSVQYPFGLQLHKILQARVEFDTQFGLETYGEKGIELFSICLTLQIHEGPSRPFFLSSRKAGELIGCHFTAAAKLMSCFVREEWLVLVTKGVGDKASRYMINSNLLNLIKQRTHMAGAPIGIKNAWKDYV